MALLLVPLELASDVAWLLLSSCQLRMDVNLVVVAELAQVMRNSDLSSVFICLQLLAHRLLTLNLCLFGVLGLNDACGYLRVFNALLVASVKRDELVCALPHRSLNLRHLLVLCCPGDRASPSFAYA